MIFYLQYILLQTKLDMTSELGGLGQPKLVEKGQISFLVWESSAAISKFNQEPGRLFDDWKGTRKSDGTGGTAGIGEMN